MKINITCVLLAFSFLYPYKLISDRGLIDGVRNKSIKRVDHITNNIYQYINNREDLQSLQRFQIVAGDIKKKKQKITYANKEYYIGDYIVSKDITKEDMKKYPNMLINVYTFYNQIFCIEPSKDNNNNNQYIITSAGDPVNTLKQLGFNDAEEYPSNSFKTRYPGYMLTKTRIYNSTQNPLSPTGNIDAESIKPNPYIYGGVIGTGVLWTIISMVKKGGLIENINGANSQAEVDYYEPDLEQSKAHITFGLGTSTIATGLFAYEYYNYMKAKEEGK